MNIKECPLTKSLLVALASSGILFFCLVPIHEHECPYHVLWIEASRSELIEVASASKKGPSNCDMFRFSSKMRFEPAHADTVAVGIFEANQTSTHVIEVFLTKNVFWIYCWHLSERLVLEMIDVNKNKHETKLLCKVEL